ncbi:hypothetical protein JCM19037_3 [Geomicrobium sp. JCM 19037]|nr:hypothetical protein [Geomicrobium sp. JCM 19037]GAK01818.1 hypothetical protein JCM19037_3 [Geomicrobium sp. JCM 19037]
MRKHLFAITAISLLAGCNQYGNDLEQDLQQDNAKPHMEDQQPNSIYVKNEKHPPEEEVMLYSDHYAYFLEQFHDELDVLYNHMLNGNYMRAEKSAETLFNYTKDMEGIYTPQSFEDVKELIVSSRVELNAILDDLPNCDGQTDCDNAKTHTENLTNYLVTMEHLYEAKINDLGITS